MSNKEKNTVYFVSDAHFGSNIENCEDRNRVFLSFLKTISPSAKSLYLLGDVFDFWIEYKYLIRSDYFDILCGLKNLIESGTAVHYCAGNHDFALGPFLEKNLGITLHLEGFDVEIQGRKVYLYHGDGILKADVGYRVLKKILRNPFNQKCYKLLPPSTGIELASSCSKASRTFLSGLLSEDKLQQYRREARRLLKKGRDIVIFGHTHCAEHYHAPEGTYCNTGNWISHYSYAKMEQGAISVWQYKEHGDDQPVTGLLKKGNKSS